MLLPVVNVPTDGAEILEMNAIEFEGQLWLVPEWLENQDERWSTPTRIIALDPSQYQGSSSSGRYIVSRPIPKSVLAGRVPPELAGRYRVVERPDIRIPWPEGH